MGCLHHFHKALFDAAFDDGIGSGLGGSSNAIGGSSVHAVHARPRGGGGGGGGGGGVGVGVGGRAAAEQASNDAAHKDLVS